MFQKKKGLKVDGLVGAKTAKALGNSAIINRLAQLNKEAAAKAEESKKKEAEAAKKKKEEDEEKTAKKEEAEKNKPMDPKEYKELLEEAAKRAAGKLVDPLVNRLDDKDVEDAFVAWALANSQRSSANVNKMKATMDEDKLLEETAKLLLADSPFPGFNQWCTHHFFQELYSKIKGHLSRMGVDEKTYYKVCFARAQTEYPPFMEVLRKAWKATAASANEHEDIGMKMVELAAKDTDFLDFLKNRLKEEVPATPDTDFDDLFETAVENAAAGLGGPFLSYVNDKTREDFLSTWYFESSRGKEFLEATRRKIGLLPPDKADREKIVADITRGIVSSCPLSGLSDWIFSNISGNVYEQMEGILSRLYDFVARDQQTYVKEIANAFSNPGSWFSKVLADALNQTASSARKTADVGMKVVELTAKNADFLKELDARVKKAKGK